MQNLCRDSLSSRKYCPTMHSALVGAFDSDDGVAAKDSSLAVTIAGVPFDLGHSFRLEKVSVAVW
jgi:hypothetical protein